jgi:ABC-type Fe3+ transport system substrate-binding protein
MKGRWLVHLVGTLVVLVMGGIPLRAEREVIIASPHWEGVQYETELAFKKYYREKTGEEVRVRWRDLGGGSSIEKAIEATYTATPKTCGIDILFGGGYDLFERQKSHGHLKAFRLSDDALNRIPSQVLGFYLVDPDYTFYGSALASFGILENVRVARLLNLPPVQTWEDLGQPKLFGWVSAGDPRKSGSVHMIYEIVLQAYGWEKGWSTLYRMGANVRSFLQSSSAPTKEVAAGDAAFAMTIDVNGMTQEAFLGKNNVRFFVPEGVSVINPDSIAILKGAPNFDVAKEFITFIMTTPGQSLWMKPLGAPGGPVKYGISRMGILPDMYEGNLGELLVPLNPFTLQQSFDYQSKVGSARWAVLDDLMGQGIIDVQTSLRAAWKAIIALPENQRADLMARFGRPLITEKQAEQYAKFWRKDKVRAGRIRNQWMIDSVERFRVLEAEAKERLKDKGN